MVFLVILVIFGGFLGFVGFRWFFGFVLGSFLGGSFLAAFICGF